MPPPAPKVPGAIGEYPNPKNVVIILCIMVKNKSLDKSKSTKASDHMVFSIILRNNPDLND